MLYKIREEKYREYINALTDKTKSPQEKYLYKKEYDFVISFFLCWILFYFIAQIPDFGGKPSIMRGVG